MRNYPPLKEGFNLSLDLYLEADNALTVPTLAQALKNAGVCEMKVVGDSLQASFNSGLKVTTDGEVADSAIYAEDTKGMCFQVSVRCNIRIKGPEPEGYSSMEELDQIAQSIAQVCSSHFLISFQFEETLYWRDAMGLHRF